MQPCDSLPAEACVESGDVDPTMGQSADLVRIQGGASIGLGNGVVIGVTVPVDVKVVDTEWFAGGRELDANWEGADRLSGASGGLGDISILGGIVDSPIGVSGLVLGVTGGASLPTGAPPVSPLIRRSAPPLTSAFGSGTVDPMARVLLFYTKEHAGFFTSAQVRVPVYATRDGYRGGAVISAVAGPTLQLPDPMRSLQLRGLITASFQTPESWHGELDEQSGRVSVGVDLGFSWNITDDLALSATLSTRPWELLRGAQFALPVTGTVGITGFIELPTIKKKDAKPEGQGH